MLRIGLVLIGLVLAALAAGTGYAVLDTRRNALADAERDAVALAGLLAAQMGHSIGEIDRALRYIEFMVGEDGLDEGKLQPLVAQISRELPQLRGILIFDANGANVIDSALSPPRPVNVGRRDYFIAHRDRPDEGLVIGAPVKSQLSNLWTISLSRPLRDRDGRFVGVVAAALDPEYFLNSLKEVRLRDGVVAISRSDGILLLRDPFVEAEIGQDRRSSPIFAAMAGREAALIRARSAADGVERIIAGRRFEQFPLAASASIGVDAALADWKVTSTVLVGSAAVLGSLVVLLGWIVGRGLERMAAQERQLADASGLLRTTLAHMGQGVLVVDGADRVVLANRQLAAILGIDPAEILPGASLVRLAESAGVEPELFAGAAGPELERQLDDGRWIAFQIDAMPGGRLVTLVDDITSRKSVETELRRLASIDPLTQLHNRRYFFELADRELRRMQRGGTPAAVALIDIDHFKRLNDIHGHFAGDQALREVAACFRATLRSVDASARIGGEEFAILMPATSLAAAEVTMQHLRQAIEMLVVSAGATTISCTVSIGIAPFGTAGIEAALKAADEALYRAKTGGRNQVMMAA
ncbi:MAG: sensor domain-containing diguanylate cyclase [Ferrovibrionaceae bacterium]